ncbi:hypothetical protein [Paenibacillus sp. YYML68]|uniref:hypothetical protein n=1 Tax=Paenibacillus sp. YYML68 TaxID=2909250 RepID=UPI0024919B19|nr:hypothetical protein [Paenibacillus sp. YYML68]
MAEFAADLFHLLKYIIAYMLLFYWLPALVVPPHVDEQQERPRPMDRWMVSMVHSHFFIIVVVHVLALSKLFETISLYCVIILTFVFLLRKRAKEGSLSIGVYRLTTLLDLSDNRMKLRQLLLKSLRKVRLKTRRAIHRTATYIRQHPVVSIGLIGSIGCSAYIVFRHALLYAYYASSDPYVHLKWAKALSTNIIYIDGVYPYGYEAVIAALNKFYMMDPYYIVRYIGPLTGVLILFTIFYVLRRLFPKDLMLIVLTFVIITASSWLFGGYVWRQMSALSMEYGILFFAPGIYYLISFLRTGRSYSLILAAECLVLTLFIHPYVAVCHGVAYIIVFVVYADKVLASRSMLRIIAIFLAAGILGMAPLALGILAGLEFHQTSIDFIKDSVTLDGAEQTWADKWKVYQSNRFFFLFLFCMGALAVLLALSQLLRKRVSLLPQHSLRSSMVFLLLGLFFFCVYQAGHLGLPVFIPEYRLEAFFVLGAAILMALTISTAGSLLRSTKLSNAFKLLSCSAALLFFFSNSGHAIPEGDRFQYDDAARAYLRIQGDFPHQEWTIVSTIEEYPLVIGYGWHYNLWEFVRDITGQGDAERVSFPTNYVFWFVEKVPLGTERHVTEADAAQPFPTIQGDRLDDYYRNKDSRTVLEAKTYYWAEAYRQKHPGRLEVYEDTPSMRIYLLKQDGNNPYDLLR